MIETINAAVFTGIQHHHAGGPNAPSVVYKMDCVQGMSAYPDNYFDLALVDPPYGIKKDGNRPSTSRNGGRKAHKRKNWDSMPPDAAYFKELFRVSKAQIIWGANYYPQHLSASMGWIFWDKGQRIDNSDGELAYTSFQKALRVVTINRTQLQREGGTIHPTQKPIKLYDFCLKFAGIERGMRVLDTHVGSQSSRISAHRHGLHYTGFETDDDYFTDGNTRFDNYLLQGTLF